MTDTTIPDDIDTDWSAVQAHESNGRHTADEFITAPYDDAPTNTAEGSYDHPNPEFIKAARRKPHAAAYERKVQDVLHAGMRLGLSNELTVPDGAAIIQYGPAIATAVGDLAAEEKWAANAVDFITGGTTTPAMAAILAIAPLALQIVRNHEPVAEVEKKPLRIWRWTLPIKVRFRIKLGRLRPMTHDPESLRKWVLSDERIQAALAKQGITVATK